MKLLVATDHTFYRTPDGVFDTFCFDRAFFADYRAVFDEVLVAARMNTNPPPEHAHRSDGNGVRFVDLENVHGARWALAPTRVYCSALPPAVAAVDAVCVRLPAVSGVFAARLAHRGAKPVMFEQVGDPRLIGAFGLMGRLFGAYLTFFTRRIVRQAAFGSYVSQVHLQRGYPAGPGTITAGISSIRLPDAEIRPARLFDQPLDRLRLVLVASLHRYKDHVTLLKAVGAAAGSGVQIELDLIGDGPERVELNACVRELEIQQSVRFRGHVAGRAQVNELLDSSDLFVMPSLGEGMPRALVEAMSRGLPTLGARTPAMEELLPSDQMFSAGDHETLKTKLLAAARDPSLLRAWAKHSEATVRRFADSVLSGKRKRLLTGLRDKARERHRHG